MSDASYSPDEDTSTGNVTSLHVFFFISMHLLIRLLLVLATITINLAAGSVLYGNLCLYIIN